MRRLSFLLCYCLILTLPAHAEITQHFKTIQSDPNALYAFFKTMPKGGELHYHLEGGAYPETMLALAANGEYCLNKATWIMEKSEPCIGISSADLIHQPDTYQQTLQAWSMFNFTPGSTSGHDHFFATFLKFMPIISDIRPQLLAEIMQRAANQHLHYLEIMVSLDNARSAQLAHLAPESSNWDTRRNALLAHPEFQQNITNTVEESTRLLDTARQYLACDKHPDHAACNLTVKFQYYVLREQPLEQVFAQALHGFEAATRAPNVVGVNLVQAEDGIISLRDYRQHMQLFQFMHALYPDVHIALHAGELAPESVRPEELRFHIHDAIFTGQAQRIGHGVSIAYEDKAPYLLTHMAKNNIPVEINLTSNQKILNIEGKQHPLRYYLANQVPVVLSTDDEGVLRTDLTRQYVEAAFQHQLDYATIKQINRNALTYSFLPGKSLWADAARAIPVKACIKFDTPSCQDFLKYSEKARLQHQLEQALQTFEAQF